MLEILLRISNHKRPAERLRARFKDGDGLRVAITVYKEDVLLRGVGLRSALGHGHCFGGGSSFVEKGSVRDVEAGEVGDHGLEVDDGFETTLADLRLVGRVRGVPGRIFKDVALNHRRGQRPVISLANQRCKNLVLRCDLAHTGEGFGLSQRGAKGELAGSKDARRDSLCDELFHGACADGPEHRNDIRGRWSDVAAGKSL